MKKTLIAIAALAATGAFAQSTVTISGVMDAGLNMATVQNNATALAATAPAGSIAPLNGTFNKVNSFVGNNTATTAINIAGVEDLGAGMKASFFIETNPDMSGAVSAGTQGGLPAGSAGTAFGNGQRFVGLSGGFGSIKMGSPNSATLEVIGMSNPFGTALGGGYGGGGFSRIGDAATATAAATASIAANATSTGLVGAQTRVIRADRSIRWDSANYSGFSGSFNYAFPNAATNGQTLQVGAQTIGLTYSAGPLNVGYATTSLKASGTSNGTLAPLTNVLSTNGGGNFVGLAAGESVTYNALSANYKFGATTVYAGYTSNKRNVAANEDGNSTNLAVRHEVSSALSVSGNYLTRKDSTTAAANAKLLGLGLDYALSKRTSAYGRYEKFDLNTANDTAGESKVFAFGVRHAF